MHQASHIQLSIPKIPEHATWESTERLMNTMQGLGMPMQTNLDKRERENVVRYWIVAVCVWHQPATLNNLVALHARKPDTADCFEDASTGTRQEAQGHFLVTEIC